MHKTYLLIFKNLNTMTDFEQLSQFSKTEAFKALDKETQNSIKEKMHSIISGSLESAIKPILEQSKENYDIKIRYDAIGKALAIDMYGYDGKYESYQPDLYKGLAPYKFGKAQFDIKWIIGGDSQGVIPIIRMDGKYGLFRPSFTDEGIDQYYSLKNPFRYDDVKISAPAPDDECYNNIAFMAALINGKWNMLIVEADSHPLLVVEGAESFEQAKVEFESAIGQKSEYPWLSFDEFGAPE